MSFFKHFIPVKAKAWITLDKTNYVENEPITGKFSIEAKDYVQAQEVRIEARVFENYQAMETVVINNQRINQQVHKKDTLFSRDTRVSGPSDFGQGPQRDFPFSVGLPLMRPTHGGGSVEYEVKGVVSIHGRPDITGATQISMSQGTGYPAMQPGMQPVGYGPTPQYPGYGMPPAYQGPAPMYPGYGAPGFGQPQGYPTPQYPQQAQPAQQAPQVRCKYCQGMMPQAANACPNCGAHQ
jgi:hypothetical protein